MNKKFLVLCTVLAVCFLSFSMAPNNTVKALSYYDAGYASQNVGNVVAANEMVGFWLNQTSIAALIGENNVLFESLTFVGYEQVSGTVNLKAAVWDGTTLTVGSESAVLDGGTLSNPKSVTISLDYYSQHLGEYAETYFCIIGDKEWIWNTAQYTLNTKGYDLTDSTNSYTSPSSPIDATVSSFNWIQGNGFVRILYGEGEPTPTATPGGETPFEGGDIGAIIEFLIQPSMIALFIVLMCGVVGAWAAGFYGFAAGLMVGAILMYIAGYFPLWGLVALIIVDGLMILGFGQSRPMQQGNNGGG